MATWVCVAIPTETGTRFRAAGTDDTGNPLRRMLATGGSGFPWRHCLGFDEAGEAMLLGTFNLPRPHGIYWTPSPVFVHQRECVRLTAVDAVAPIIAEGTLVSVRAYDAADRCLYDVAQVRAGPVGGSAVRFACTA